MAKGVLADEIQYQDGVVYLSGHNTKIKIISAHKKLSCTTLKNKQDSLDRCKELDLNTKGSLTTLKDRLMCHFEKKVAEYEAKAFQRDTVNIFRNLKFTSICLVDKDSIYATTNNDRSASTSAVWSWYLCRSYINDKSSKRRVVQFILP